MLFNHTVRGPPHSASFNTRGEPDLADEAARHRPGAHDGTWALKSKVSRPGGRGEAITPKAKGLQDELVRVDGMLRPQTTGKKTLSLVPSLRTGLA